MAQEVTNRYLLFAGLRELGPVLGDRRVDIEKALVGETVRADRGDAFGCREDVDDRVPLPGA